MVASVNTMQPLDVQRKLHQPCTTPPMHHTLSFNTYPTCATDTTLVEGIDILSYDLCTHLSVGHG